MTNVRGPGSGISPSQRQGQNGIGANTGQDFSKEVRENAPSTRPTQVDTIGSDRKSRTSGRRPSLSPGGPERNSRAEGQQAKPAGPAGRGQRAASIGGVQRVGAIAPVSASDLGAPSKLARSSLASALLDLQALDDPSQTQSIEIVGRTLNLVDFVESQRLNEVRRPEIRDKDDRS